MFIVGLTGGIGSGKSTVSALFAELGVPVIDADDIGKQLVAPGSPALEAITDIFGKTILNADGSLNRAALRDTVFDSPAQRAKLEAILHPAILDEMQRQAAQLTSPYCIFAIPLLLESNQAAYVDRVLVVDCDPALQKSRVAQRSGLNDAQIQAIMASQLSRDMRLQRAEDIIHNDTNIDDLRPQVLTLHQKYLSMSY